MKDKKTYARDAHGATAGRSELLLRVVSSLVMVAGALFLTTAGLWPFALLVGGVAAILCWEWGGMVRPGNPPVPLAVHVIATLIAAGLEMAGNTVAALTLLAAGAMALAVFPASSGQERRWSAAGALYFGLPVLSLVALRGDDQYGLNVILFIFAIVWSADTAAYFTGRAFGGPKLAPNISPGKTWSGLAGGLAFPVLVSAAFAIWVGGTSPVMLAGLAGALAFVSQLGDLVESYAKRNFRQKDSSHLIPGHGGFLDRVDGLIFAAAAAWMLGLLRNPGNPAQALLIWP